MSEALAHEDVARLSQVLFGFTRADLETMSGARRAAWALLDLPSGALTRLGQFRDGSADLKDLSLSAGSVMVERLMELQPGVWGLLVAIHGSWSAGDRRRSPTSGDDELILESVAQALVRAADSSAGVRGNLPEEGELGPLHPDEDAVFKNYAKYRAVATHLRTHQDVATAAGVSIGTVVSLANRKGKPQFRTLERIAGALGVTIQQLLGHTR